MSRRVYAVYWMLACAPCLGLRPAALHADCLPGDVNGDRRADLLDLEPFIEELISPQFSTTARRCAADLTGDGRVDGDDISPFVQNMLVAPQPPVAILAAGATSGPAPLTVEFNAGLSFDPDGAILQFAWDFGDGDSSTGPDARTATHAYEAAGFYEVVVTVTDDDGLEGCAALGVRVGAANALSLFVDNTLNEDCIGQYNPVTRACGGGAEYAVNSLARAAALAIPGMTVLIRGGVFTEPLEPQASGIEGLPITYRAFGCEEPLITDPEMFPAVNISNRSHLVIEGLHVVNVRRWLYAVNTHHCVLRGNVFRLAVDPFSSSKTGLFFQEAAFNRILDNVIDDGEQDNLALHACDRNLIEGNVITSAQHALWTVKCGNFNVIRGNFFHNDRQKIGEIFDCEDAGFDHEITRLDATKHNLVERNVFAHAPPNDQPHRTSAVQYSAQEGIFRNNVFHDNYGSAFSFQTYSDEALHNKQNRIFHNVFFENDCGAIHLGGDVNEDFFDNLFVNNILLANHGCLHEGAVQFIVDGTGGFVAHHNDVLFNGPADAVILWRADGEDATTLAWAQTNRPLLFSENLQVDPRFADPAALDFHLRSDSPLIDAGAFLTRAVGDGVGTLLPVQDASWFYDGYGIPGESGDRIRLQGNTTSVEVIAIDYKADTLTLSAPLSWTNGQGVSLLFSGSAPDIGAFEFDAPP